MLTFRKKSLEQVTSPERLDELMWVITPASWMVFAALFFIIAGILFWSIFGNISTQVFGKGVFYLKNNVLATKVYLADQDSAFVKPGMKVLIEPENIRTEVFGKVIGSVESVYDSDFSEKAEKVEISSQDIAYVNLVLDNSFRSGVRWTSKKSISLTIKPGMKCIAAITVQEQAPISLVIPGIEKLLRIS